MTEPPALCHGVEEGDGGLQPFGAHGPARHPGAPVPADVDADPVEIEPPHDHADTPRVVQQPVPHGSRGEEAEPVSSSGGERTIARPAANMCLTRLADPGTADQVEPGDSWGSIRGTVLQLLARHSSARHRTGRRAESAAAVRKPRSTSSFSTGRAPCRPVLRSIWMLRRDGLRSTTITPREWHRRLIHSSVATVADDGRFIADRSTMTVPGPRSSSRGRPDLSSRSASCTLLPSSSTTTSGLIVPGSKWSATCVSARTSTNRLLRPVMRKTLTSSGDRRSVHHVAD